MMFVSAQACGSQKVCAIDLRSGGPQNFDSECKMYEENNRGGSKFSKAVQIFHGNNFKFNRIRKEARWNLLNYKTIVKIDNILN
jgi:hypothetical protein